MIVGGFRRHIVGFVISVASVTFLLFAADDSHGQSRAGTGPRKLALLVGISQYERGRGEPTDWWNLSSGNDVETMRKVLVERFDFAEGDVRALSDSMATRQGIVDAFERHLIAQARPGDIVVFHYSGHGQQVADDNGDEFDGKDESLIPFDYLSQSAEDGAKTNLRDDQIAGLLQRLKEKMTGPRGAVEGNITVFMDCCFSGTATRGRPEHGRLRERGRGWVERLDGPAPRTVARGKEESASGLLERGAALAQDYVVISACRSDQTAKEMEGDQGHPMGVLTYYLTRALSRATPRTTYRALFERLNVEVTGPVRDQNPQLEGNVDKLLFAGAALPVATYLVVRKVSGETVTLPVGQLQGATVGSRFALCRPESDVHDPKSRFAEVEVVGVDETTCSARLTGPYAGRVKSEDLVAARAVETAHNYGESRLRVFLEAMGRWAEAVKGLEALTTEGVTADNYDLRIYRPKERGGALVLERKGGSVLGEIAEDDQTPGRVREALLGEWRWQFLSQLRNDDPNAQVKIELRLVPVNVQADSRGRVQKVLGVREDVERTDGNHLILRDGDYVVIELRNPSRSDVYVTVLDLVPDGSINPVFPHPEIPGADNKIKADGEWRRIPLPFVFRMGRPYGHEVFKAIATNEEADFSPLLYSKTVQEVARTRGGEADLLRGLPEGANPLGRLLFSVSTGKRGGEFAGVAPTYWATAEAPFEVREK